MSTLVIGATGNVGSAITDALVAAGLPVRALVRSPRPLPDGVEPVAGDLLDDDSLRTAIAGMEAVAFIAPHHERQQEIGERVVKACEDVGTERMVYCSSWHPRPNSRLGRMAVIGAMRLIASHYVPMLKVEERVVSSSVPSVVLGPSNFFQNDELLKPEILEGVYGQPLGVGMDRVDLKDLGDAAVRAVRGELEPGYYPIVGETLGGEASAKVWGEVLGRDMRYDGDIDAWHARMNGRLTGKTLADFRSTYQLMKRAGLNEAKPAERERCRLAVGHEPTPYIDYCRRTLARWQA